MSRPRLTLLHQTFGLLVVIEEAGTMKNGRARLSAWRVRCACGTEKKVVGSHLVTGRVKSCGCVRRNGWIVPVEIPEGHSYCWGCRRVRATKFFYKDHTTQSGMNTRCIECYRARKAKSLERIRQQARERSKRIRREVLQHYGGKCECCGEFILEFLALDHIEGGGGAHRKKINTGNFAWWLKRNGYPKGYRVLCHNCNMARGIYGYCPHEHLIIVG